MGEGIYRGPKTKMKFMHEYVTICTCNFNNIETKLQKSSVFNNQMINS